MFRRVAEFHRAIGQPMADHPLLPDPVVRTLRQTLLAEELEEFCSADAVNDRIEMADALADLCYIIAGTVVIYGLGPQYANDTFESPYDCYLPRAPSNAHGMADLLRDCFIDYKIAEASDHLSRIDFSLMNMITTIYGVAWRLNIPLNAVFAEVHRSNMAKIMPDGTVLRRADGKILKSSQWHPPDIAGVLERHVRILRV
jgi:predicted HAD superfamily Cof-like phosphohydrolase